MHDIAMILTSIIVIMLIVAATAVFTLTMVYKKIKSTVTSTTARARKR